MTFLESLNFRHACKIFDENRKISDDDFAKILEAGRLSASSLGLEHWDLLLIKNKDLIQKLKEICWNQPQISTASHLVVILTKIKDFKIGSEYVKDMVSRRVDKNSSEHTGYLDKINGFLRDNVGQNDLEIFAWSKAQCFLLVQNMMSMAALLGIDSCPIEGWYSEDEVLKALGIDRSDKRVALILPFGYRVNEPKPKIRRNIDEILTIVE